MIWFLLVIVAGLVALVWALCAAILAGRADARASSLRPTPGEQAPAERDLPWVRWLAEEKARPRPATRKVRPSIELDADLLARVDRVAAASGVSRHELVTFVLDRFLASWRPMR